MMNFIGIYIEELRQFCWDKLEEIGGSFTGLFVFTNLSFESEIQWVLKIVSTGVAMFIGGFFSYLGKKKAEKYFKVLLFVLLASFLSSCSLTYRINNQCRAYSECTIIDGKCRVCIECTDKSIIDKFTPKK
jgi:hypothetical protein